DQVGVEAIGSDDPDLDTEIIALAQRFYQRLGLQDYTLVINSLGDLAERPAYLSALTDYFQQRLNQLSEQARATLAVNPLRVLDSKRPGDAEAAAEAPTILEFLSDEARRAFERVQAGLRALAIPFVVDPRLVRGLDYYTRTTFEFTSESFDAAQNAIGGGGRYDGLVEALGGPPESGVGFSLGVDRILLACDAEGVFPPPSQAVDVWVVSTTAGVEGVELVEELRAAGISADRAYGGRSMKAQMKAANRSEAAVAVILGEDELSAGTVTVRTMRPPSPATNSGVDGAARRSDGQQTQVDRSQLIDTVRALLP
ncbi:MAG: histidine--tRNA ligase, partial [Acidimicrobiia bacterium]|nr:histidine--tRNA ligase [Acidimicrobiia bacterium]